MPRRAHHLPERDRQAGGDQEDRQYLEKIRQGRRILKGVRAVRVEKAAAVGAEHFDRLLRSDRALRDGLRRHSGGRAFAGSVGGGHGLRLQQLRSVVGAQVLHHALRHQHDRVDEADRQQHPEGRARQVDPEVAEGAHLLACDAADERDRQCEPGGCRPEIVRGEAEHLRQVAHGGFGRVGLPVGVRRERNSRAPGQNRRDGGQVLRVERQQVLQALDRIGQQQRDRGKHEQRQQVANPALLFVGLHAGHTVQQPLAGHEHRVKKRAPARKNQRHIGAHRLREQRHAGEKQGNLQPTVQGHLELLRPKQRIGQIHKEGNGDSEQQRIFNHGCAPFQASRSRVHRVAPPRTGLRW